MIETYFLFTAVLVSMCLFSVIYIIGELNSMKVIIGMFIESIGEKKLKKIIERTREKIRR